MAGVGFLRGALATKQSRPLEIASLSLAMMTAKRFSDAIAPATKTGGIEDSMPGVLADSALKLVEYSLGLSILRRHRAITADGPNAVISVDLGFGRYHPVAFCLV